MTTIRLAPVVVVQPSVVIDTGTELLPGPEMQPQPVALSDLKGCALYDQLLAAIPALQAQYDEHESSITPNRAARRSKPKASA